MVFFLGTMRTCFSLQEIETSEPCNCIHFSENNVIYGTGKFYILDIKQHVVKGLEKKLNYIAQIYQFHDLKKERALFLHKNTKYFLSEFLDCRDPSLAFAVYGAAQLNIFPIAVLDVTSAGSDQEELLLCFNGEKCPSNWIKNGSHACSVYHLIREKLLKRFKYIFTNLDFPLCPRVWSVCEQLWFSQQAKTFDVEQTAACFRWVWWYLLKNASLLFPFFHFFHRDGPLIYSDVLWPWDSRAHGTPESSVTRRISVIIVCKWDSLPKFTDRVLVLLTSFEIVDPLAQFF